MSILEAILIHHFLLFLLVLSRVGGLVTLAPMFGSAAVPATVRAFFAVGLALIITPNYSGQVLSMPVSLFDLGILVAAEVLVGLAFGLCVLTLFSGVQVAGQVIGQLSGMTLADVFDPSFENESPIFSQLLFMLGLTVFLLIGGHRMVVGSLLDTFQALPPGLASLNESIPDALVTVLTQSFQVGLRAVAPMMAAMLLATLVVGLISRTLPQLNILAFGFALNTLILYGALFVSLGGITWGLQRGFEPMLDLVQEAIIADGTTP